MTIWTLIGTGTEGETQGKTFGLSLDAKSKTWRAVGPDVAKFFSTRSGDYNMSGLPELGTQLTKPGPAEVAFLRGLAGASEVGKTGTGRASEKGVNFKWLLESK